MSQLKLSPSEAVYGFASWLTTRRERTTMSASDGSSPIAELVVTFCRENELEAPRDRWTVLLKHPPEPMSGAMEVNAIAADTEREPPPASPLDQLREQLVIAAQQALTTRDFAGAVGLVDAYLKMRDLR